MIKSGTQHPARIDWNGATLLIARIIVLLGLGLALLGGVRTLWTLFEVARGVETLANIESAAPVGATGSAVELSWRDPAGEIRRASGVPVSRLLARKLKLGFPLSRANLRIRYALANRAAAAPQSVVVMDDVPDLVKRSAALAIAGFLAIAAGSAIMVGLLLVRATAGEDAAAHRGTAGRTAPDGIGP
jgi:hypothetical protein